MTDSILETKLLTKDFGSFRAVDQVNLSIASGTLHSVIGPNGAGKTTLFNCISAVLKPTKGTVIFKGQDITGIALHKIAHLGVGRAFQITNIFPNLTVLENVRLAAQALSKHNLKLWQNADSDLRLIQQSRNALEIVGLANRATWFANALPHGDKRKLELAIILVGDPQLVLLDEPAAGMATEQVPELMHTIEQIRKHANKTILLVEHNMSVVMNYSDRITVMHQGRVLAEGTPNEISNNTHVQAAYLGVKE
jgi:branched-chain amino acid transport system ATP-binding protein